MISEKLNSYGFRKFKSRLFFVLCLLCVVIAVFPLLSILYEVIIRGAPQLSIEFLTQAPGQYGTSEGGIGPAIQGSLILIGLTSIIGIPIGILSGIYLSEFGNNKFAELMRNINNMLTQFPSIVVGIAVFGAFAFMVLNPRSALAGAAALGFLLVPVVARTTEESLKLVPNSVREASLALGVRRWRTILSVVLPTAKAGVITGALLAVARVAGETAPLIMTIIGSNYFFQGFGSQMDALPLRIYLNAIQASPIEQAKGWGAALVLILIVLALNIGVRLIANREKLKEIKIRRGDKK